MCVCFWPAMRHTSSIFQTMGISRVGLNLKERDWVCVWAKRKYKWAEMEKSEGREPSSSSRCRHACRQNRIKPAILSLLVSGTEPSWGTAVWRRSRCFWWVSLGRTSRHVCEGSLLKPPCVWDENTVFVWWRLKFGDVWHEPFQENGCFVKVFISKPSELWHGVKMFD